MATPAWITAVLTGLGAPVNANTVAAMEAWSAAEGGSNNNWLNVSPGGKLASYGTQAQGVAATVATLRQSNMAAIRNSLVQGLSPDQTKGAIIASPWSENHYAGTTFGGSSNAVLTADMTPGASNGGVTAGAAAPRQPMAGVNLANFHGYDLSSIPKEQLGDVEYGIQTYITNPNQKVASPTYDAQGNVTGSLSSSIASRLKSDYGYGSWAMNNKELAPVLIAAVVNGWDENTFTGAVTATNWYKSTSEAQRDWQITQSTDPAKAEAELAQARSKVLAVENQSGVQLTAAQAEQIARTVASNSATQTGVLGSQAGFTQEQLEQAVVKAANLGKQTSNGANTTSLGGIAGQLLNQFRSVAQDYLMYNPTDPTKGLISDSSLLQNVQDAMQKYTGSGSFGSSNLINGAVADFTQQMQQQASQFYPSLAGSIAAGTTPKAYVQPLQSLIGNTLGLDQQGINFTDPQWSWAIATPDPKTGIKTALTQDQVLQKITNPNFTFTNPSGQVMKYDNTNTAVNQAHAVAGNLASMFGVGG